MVRPSCQDTLASQDEKPTALPAADRQSWQEPELAFVESKLTAHGDLTQVPGQGLFGGFTP
jgi:hypothetical protein